MKTSPCLYFCLVYGEPLQPYGVTHVPPGVPTITQLAEFIALLFPDIPALLVPSPALRADGEEEKHHWHLHRSPSALHTSIP